MQCSRNGKARDDQGKKQEDDFQDKRQDFGACSSAHCCISAFGMHRRLASLSHHVFFPLFFYEILQLSATSIRTEVVWFGDIHSMAVFAGEKELANEKARKV